MIGDDIAAGLAAIQAEAESLLVDVCNLQRKSGTTTDPTSDMVSDVWTSYRTGIACRVRAASLQPRESVAGAQYVTAVSAVVSVSMSIDDVRIDDRVMVTESRDPSLIGVPLYVRGVPRGSQLTLRRLSVSEVQG